MADKPLSALQVAAQEALGAEQAVVAKQALLHLHRLVETDSTGVFQPGDEAVIVSNLVKVIQENAGQGEGELSCQLLSWGGKVIAEYTALGTLIARPFICSDADGPSYLSQLGPIYDSSANRLDAIGYQQFFGGDTTGR